ncbi:MAG TPA: hypothetical protein ENJ52_11700 [Aliiroseovarius sp.]|nr:hypothetical protein [Aliiroseovarius sp.]
MQLISRESFTPPRKFVGLLIFAPIVYFGLVFPMLFLLGFDPRTEYYEYSQLDRFIVAFVLVLNIIYLISSLYFFARFFPREVTVSVPNSWPLVLGVVLFVYFTLAGNLAQDRATIKSGATLVSVVLNAAAYAYLGALLLCEKNKLKLLVVASGIVLTIILTFERESILYLAFPLVLRLGRHWWAWPMLVLFGIAGAIFLGGYKYILTLTLLSGEPLSLELFFRPEFWEYVSRSFMTDNLHKSSLELFYFQGDAPHYNILTYFMPYQIARMLDPLANTNGGIATLYYTAGYTGTGYSALLESWQNFWILGPVIMPGLLFLGFRQVVRSGSAFLFITMLVFSLKLQRAELWPTVLGIALGPILFFAAGRLLRLLRKSPGAGRPVKAATVKPA